MPLHSSLKALLDNVLDAVVIIDRDGLVRGWNAIAEQSFGWSAEEARGRALSDLIVPPEHRDSHRNGLKRFNATGTARVLNRRLQLSALTRTGATVPIELTITLVSTPSEEVFVGFLRDISDRILVETQSKQLALESRLLFEMSAMASESPSLDEALEAALNAICELTQWPVGHAYLVTDDGEKLHSRAWSRHAHNLAPAFVAKTERTSFAIGEGMPGRILQSGQPLWIEDTSDDVNFPRKDLGWVSAFGFPVLSSGRTIAILEFFSATACPPDEHVLKLVQSLGAQVGRVFERFRRDERREVIMGEMAHRTKNLISVIQGIASQTFKGLDGGAGNDALRLFYDRLAAVGKAQTALFERNLETLSLEDIIVRSVEGCGVDVERVDVSGPPVSLSPSASVMMSLAIHELSTNAFKYGALSVSEGTVAVTWELCTDGSKRFNLRWQEFGGPPVVAPETSGFGDKILGRAMQSETGGRTRLCYDPDGLVYELTEAAST